MNLLKPVFIFLFIHFFFFLPAQTIFSYGDHPVSKEEFLKAFLKNNSQQSFSEKDYRDYLNLYTRFKLRVQAAYDQQLDTLASQKTELRDFRNQVIDEFVNDQSSLDRLIKEAFDRSQKDIHLAHIFIPAAAGADTAQAWRKATDALNELKKGTDFKNVAIRYSADTSVKSNQGDIGWITAFTLPYSLENIAYNTPAGNFSPPYRSSLGYHIFKSLGERKAVGRLKTAQILLAFFPDASEPVQQSTRRKADSVYNLLLKGAFFPDMVSMFSNDRASFSTGGEMEEFGLGKYDPSFTDAVYALTQGAISKPILTSYGYHIIKLLQHLPVSTDPNNREVLVALKQQVLADAPRMEISRQAAGKRIAGLVGYKKLYDPKKIGPYADSALRGRKFAGITDQTPLFSFGKEQVRAGDWIKYLQDAGGVAALNGGKTYNTLLDQFTALTQEQYYKNRLEEYNPAFAAQMKEFKDGNLLFEIMQRNIWQKAAADSAALLTYYQQNKVKYWWEASADAILFTCKDSATALEVQRKLEKNRKDWRTIILSYGESVQADSGRYELTQLPVHNVASLAANTISTPIKSASENTAFLFAYVTRIYPEKSPRTFEDAKGFVLNDYQSYLEDKWIESLRNKYPIKVNEAALHSLWK